MRGLSNARAFTSVALPQRGSRSPCSHSARRRWRLPMRASRRQIWISSSWQHSRLTALFRRRRAYFKTVSARRRRRRSISRRRARVSSMPPPSQRSSSRVVSIATFLSSAARRCRRLWTGRIAIPVFSLAMVQGLRCLGRLRTATACVPLTLAVTAQAVMRSTFPRAAAFVP